MRSLWGWGDVEARADLKETQSRIEPFFGPSEPETEAPPKVPAPRVELPSALRDFSTAADDARAAHTWGKSYVDRVRGFRGDFEAAPDFVATPRSEEELTRVLELAEQQSLCVTPFGGGSSVVGGTEPRLGPDHRGAVSLDLAALNRVLELDHVSHTARIQAGTFGPALEAQLGERGFTLRHFPQSFEFSTLGGWVATRAGGHFATGPTHIDELVESVRMVSPRGLVESRRFPSTGAGVDVNKLLIGSEGTLGVITEAWVRVRPKPKFRAGASVHFDDFERAVDATRAVAQSGLLPSNCRLLDAQEALINGVSFDGSSVLVLAFESADHELDAWLHRALAITASLGGVAKGRSAADSWRASFLRGPYLQDAMIQLGMLADTFETACTWAAFPNLYREVTQAVQSALAEVCGGGVVSCRFTHVYADGPAPYFTFLGRAKRGGEVAQWRAVKAAASQALVRAGGTITHHHAVGRTHREWIDAERPALFTAALRAAKGVFDPAGVLNPGVLF